MEKNLDSRRSPESVSSGLRSKEHDELRRRLVQLEIEIEKRRAAFFDLDCQIRDLRSRLPGSPEQSGGSLPRHRKVRPGLLAGAWRRFASPFGHAAARIGLLRDASLLRNSRLFDAGYYLRQNPDVAAEREDALWHFLIHGADEGRNPHPLFDVAYYCGTYPGVAASGVNPLVHYLKSGAMEGKNPARYFRGRQYSRRYGHSQGGESVLHFLDGGFGPVEKPRVSIIIPFHNRADLTLSCLASLACLGDSASFEVIVVDDGSSDAPLQDLERLPGVARRRHESSEGFVASCNEGARMARGKFLVFLNNDTEVRDGWLDSLCRVFTDHPDAGLAGSKLLYPDGRLQEAGSVIWRDGSGCNYGRGEDPHRPEYNFLREVHYCSGASLMIPAPLFNKLGGLSTEFSPAYYEDVDLAFRVREAGRKVFYQPYSEVVHIEGASCGTDENRGVKSFQAVNRNKFLARWGTVLEGHRENHSPPFRLAAVENLPRLLVIDTWFPTPDQDAGSLRMRHLLELFISMGYRVTFIPQNMNHNGDYVDDLQHLGVECVYLPYYQGVRHFLSERGGEFAAVWITRIGHAKEFFDAVHFLAPTARVILDTVDLHFLRLERQAVLTGRPEDVHQSEQTRRDELRLGAASDAMVVVSKAEQDLLSGLLPKEKVHHVSTITVSHPVNAGFSERRGVLFVGGFRHPPNEDAVRYLVEEIWPLVRARRPQALLYVVGSHLPEWIAKLRAPGVEVPGYLPDLAPLYGEVVVSVAPLRFGAGIKGKINESMAYGVPVVTTSIGAEGIPGELGRNMLVADNPRDFADAILRLMEDEALWQTISREGRKTIEHHFSPAAARKGLEGLFANLGLPLTPDR